MRVVVLEAWDAVVWHLSRWRCRRFGHAWVRAGEQMMVCSRTACRGNDDAWRYRA